MIQDLTHTLLLRFTFDLAVLALAILACFFVAWKNRRNLFLMLLAPVIMLAALDGYRSIDAILGTSSFRTLPEDQVIVLAVHEEKKWVHLWYLDEQLKQPRAIKVEPTDKNKKTAKSLAKKLREGRNAFAGVKRQKNGVDSTETTDIIEYDFNHKFHSRKDGRMM